MLETIAAVIANLNSSCCAVLIDLDETIFNPLFKWQEHISSHLKVDFSVKDIELAGSLDDLFKNTSYYGAFHKLAEQMRSDEQMYYDLPIINGANGAINQLLQMQNLKIGGYLTARPFNVISITKQELMKHGFPSLPVLARPKEISFVSSVQWKLDILNSIRKIYNGTLIMIDDKPELALALSKQNYEKEKPIVAILFNGPLTYTYIQRERLTTNSAYHFYIANWDDIPAICKTYSCNL